MIARALGVLFALICWALPAHGHEVRPAYLEIVESGPGVFDITWKTPAAGAGALAVAPEFSQGCDEVSPRRAESTGEALLTRWRVSCPHGLGQQIRIAGLERTLTSAFVRVRWRDGRTAEGPVSATAPRLSFSRPPAVWSYLSLGAEHILTGFDHLGFIAGLVLIVTGARRLLVTLTAFTLAHSLTLSAAALGVFGLPQRPVEAVIAFSIAVVAREAFLAAKGQAGVAARAPWVIAFAFGLLHGFGFANALAQVGLPSDARIGALLLFNAGVEAGQILVVSLLAPALYLLRRGPPARGAVAEQCVAAALGALAMFWVIERVLA